MADYRERIAAKIKREMAIRGEDKYDLARAVDVEPRTVERWMAAETEPQRRVRKPLADHFETPMEEFWPDLELQEEVVIGKLDELIARQHEVLSRMDQLEAQLAMWLPAQEAAPQAPAKGHKSRTSAKKPAKRRATG